MSDQEIKHDGTMADERSNVVRWKVCRERGDHGSYTGDICPTCEFERVKDQPIPVHPLVKNWFNPARQGSYTIPKEQADRLVENARKICSGILPHDGKPVDPITYGPVPIQSLPQFTSLADYIEQIKQLRERDARTSQIKQEIVDRLDKLMIEVRNLRGIVLNAL